MFIGGLALAGGRDAQDAENVAREEQQAYEKKAALIGMPCTWICQKYHDREPCGQAKNTRCVSADLTESK